MPLIKNPGKEIQLDEKTRIIMAIIGPIVQTPEGNHLPYIYSCYYCGDERVQGWTYRGGPVRKAELVTKNGQKTLWFGWR